MRLPEKTFVHSYILMKYRPYSIKHMGFCVWGQMSHSNPFKIIFDYMKMFFRINVNTTGSSNGRTADFDSANLGSSPSPVANQSNGDKL